MLEFILLPWQLPFLQNAMIISMIIALPTALISCFLVLRGWSLLGDAVSHSVLPGIVLAYISGIPLLLGALGSGLVCVGLISYIDQHSRLKRDTVMGVVFSAMFALGIVLYVKISSDIHLDHILFGDLLGVGLKDMIYCFIIAVLVVGLISLKSADLLLSSFDENQARLCGLRVKSIQILFLMMISVTIVSTLKATGLIMAIGLLIAPGAIAFLIARRFRTMLLIGVFVTEFCSILGIYFSLYLDSAPAPTIILLMGLCFLLVFGWRNVRMKMQMEKVRMERVS